MIVPGHLPSKHPDYQVSLHYMLSHAHHMNLQSKIFSYVTNGCHRLPLNFEGKIHQLQI